MARVSADIVILCEVLRIRSHQQGATLHLVGRAGLEPTRSSALLGAGASRGTRGYLLRHLPMSGRDDANRTRMNVLIPNQVAYH